MKRCAEYIVLAVAIFATSCDIPTPFTIVDDTKVRLIDFIYEPAEASPGDTVTMRALFAGRKVSPGDIDWSISCKVLKNVAGVDTAYDIKPLDGTVDSCFFSDQTSCISVRFVVPGNCMTQSPMVRENMAALFSSGFQAMLPEGFDGASLDKTLMMVDSLSKVVASADTQSLQAFSDIMPDLVAQLPLLTQLLTVPIRIIADVAGEHRIESDFEVSYTRRFARLPGSGLYRNNNPAIDSVGIYKVKGADLMSYDPGGDGVEYFRLFGQGDSTTVIPIDIGYSYFVEVAVGGRDTVVTLGDIAGGAPAVKVEDLSADWMHQLNTDETSSFSIDQLMAIGGLGDLYGILSPPQKESARHFTIWVQVTDSKLGVLNRSQGSTVAEVRGEFSYTSAYLKQFEKKGLRIFK